MLVLKHTFQTTYNPNQLKKQVKSFIFVVLLIIYYLTGRLNN